MKTIQEVVKETCSISDELKKLSSRLFLAEMPTLAARLAKLAVELQRDADETLRQLNKETVRESG